MALPASPPLTFVRGDDETVIVVVCSDAAGAVPVTITGRTYTLAIGTAGSTVISAAGSVVGATGTVTFVFTAVNTALLTGTQYAYEVVEVASALASTIILAPLTVLSPVTP